VFQGGFIGDFDKGILTDGAVQVFLHADKGVGGLPGEDIEGIGAHAEAGRQGAAEAGQAGLRAINLEGGSGGGGDGVRGGVLMRAIA